ncbi:hypothetical protein EXW51_27125 [Bacillus mycoides]|nr:hypothetical protein EXW51_27125 [Bacillus mycoides]
MFVLNKKQSHDVVIAFLCGIIKKIYPTKGEFASSYISDRVVRWKKRWKDRVLDLFHKEGPCKRPLFY